MDRNHPPLATLCVVLRWIETIRGVRSPLKGRSLSMSLRQQDASSGGAVLETDQCAVRVRAPTNPCGLDHVGLAREMQTVLGWLRLSER